MCHTLHIITRPVPATIPVTFTVNFLSPRELSVWRCTHIARKRKANVVLFCKLEETVYCYTSPIEVNQVEILKRVRLLLDEIISFFLKVTQLSGKFEFSLKTTPQTYVTPGSALNITYWCLAENWLNTLRESNLTDEKFDYLEKKVPSNN